MIELFAVQCWRSDIARKREQLDRLRQRKVAFDDELKLRSGELNSIKARAWHTCSAWPSKEEHKFAQKKQGPLESFGVSSRESRERSLILKSFLVGQGHRKPRSTMVRRRRWSGKPLEAESSRCGAWKLGTSSSDGFWAPDAMTGRGRKPVHGRGGEAIP